MRPFERRQAFVDGVGGAQPAGLEAEPREQGVGLRHLLDGWRYGVLLATPEGLRAVAAGSSVTL